ncbi:redoxin domain-containing protein [Sphingobacterium olei]|uniref:Redoxin domain-containing protein n=1 Tax=Sphingobacterium olei TaxID=2571155 RepID=A0A4U0P756_9SPHI|nr:redoxin domain-containing protein [Sphingobacterium olei]TJZ63321.1 redoxin domain-containing protein [Sphingobacterium olei]
MRFLFILVQLTSMLYAQTLVTPIGIGEELPPLTIENILNSEHRSMDLSELKGKHIVFDFGSTYCPPCIESLGKMESLKRLFGENMEFFMVMHEPVEKVDKFLQHSEVGKSSTIPIIAADTILHQKFRHIAQPHIVWIDEKGIAKAFTGREYLSIDYIKSYLQGHSTSWPVKWDFPYDKNKAMLVFNPDNFNHTNTPKRFISSMVSDHMEGLVWGGKSQVDPVKKQIRLTAINLNFLQLYLRNFSRTYDLDFFNAQVLVDTAGSDKYFYSPKLGSRSKWNTKNTYCYEMVFPLSMSQSKINERIVQQLNLYFGLDVQLKNLKRPCWVLSRVSASKIEKVNVDENGVSVKGLLRTINRIPFHLPAVIEKDLDFTAYNGLVLDVDLTKLDDIDKINHDLESYGLTFKILDHEIETLVIEKN